MAGLFIVQLTRSFRKDIERLPNQVQPKVLQAVKLLEVNPFGPSPKIKKLKGEGIGQWRLEIWPYRVRYDVVGKEVALYRFRHRKDIYRD